MLPERSIAAFMKRDHERIGAFLRRSEGPDGRIDDASYQAFRGALLRHIGMEEKVLLPMLRRSGAEISELGARLRSDHGRIARLLVRRPSPEIIAALRAILGEHDALEEGEPGLYAMCDAFAGDDAEDVIAQLQRQPEVPLAKYYDGP